MIWIRDTKREDNLVEGEVVDRFETNLDKSTTADEVSLIAVLDTLRDNNVQS